jgi:hypothetical protein
LLNRDPLNRMNLLLRPSKVPGKAQVGFRCNGLTF